MKHPGPPESSRLAFCLENALAREARIWKVPVFQNLTLKGTDIPLSCYKKAVLWIAEISSQFQFYPETFALATSIFNRLLASVKAQLKYLQCIAISCLVLAAKTNEEDEVIPSVKTLAVRSGCKRSSAEILRMERIILDRLHWDLYTATPMDFLNIVSAEFGKIFCFKETAPYQIRLEKAAHTYTPPHILPQMLCELPVLSYLQVC
ncbi:cyclin-I2 [Athene cunicularia]|uniref:cyclin-I2 n=1 Tax=Athene cunicularia TaxID=194338 RepID=UPI000EF72DA0|nr:cyclin-I2 [Athene cunicularia]